MAVVCHENKAVTSPPQTLSKLAPGFRFHPTDEELVRYYLTRKVCGKNVMIDAISEADIYKMEPWDLPGLSRMRSRDLEWYFYSALDKKYGNGARMNRATSKGYWKATGNDRSVKHGSQTVGMKKTLVFHKGRAPGGKRTNWVMHEYRLVDEEFDRLGAAKDGFVLCRVFQKSGLGPPNGDQYAPFDESEWDDDQLVLLPGAETVDEGLLSDEAGPRDGSSLEGNGQEEKPEDTQPETADHKLQERDFLSTALVCKNEKHDTWSLPSIVRAKRPRHFFGADLSRVVKSSSSSDPSLSIKTAATMADAAAIAARTLLEFPKETSQPNGHSQSSKFDIASFDVPVHPSYLDLISNLQNEIHTVSSERDDLRIEMMHAQAMIDVLQSRIEFLLQENDNLKKSDDL